MRDHRSQPMERKPGWPEGDDDVINKYGTYEVQRTNGVEHPYPMIAQGLSQKEAAEQLAAAERWRAKGKAGEDCGRSGRHGVPAGLRRPFLDGRRNS